jgi:hypothetical protein
LGGWRFMRKLLLLTDLELVLVEIVL